MKNITRVALLCFSVALAGCISSVSDDEETMYGTFSTSQAEQKTADGLVRKVVDFQEEYLGQAQFIDGYSVVSANADYQLYLGRYQYEEQEDFHSTKSDWASFLQTSNKADWKEYKTADGADKDADDLSKGKYGETQYETNSLQVNGKQAPTAAVLVKYKEKDDQFWVYLALPKEMIKASEDEDVIELFNKYRYSK